MKKFISTSVFAAALLIVGACSNNNGQVQAEPDSDPRKTLLTEVAEATKLYRYVDCEARVAVYFMNDYRSGVAVVNNVDQDLFKKKCGNQ